MHPARQRALVTVLGLAAAGVVGWGGWRWDVWAQRRAIVALQAADPSVRAAAARELRERMPRLREEVVPGLITALESGWDAPLPPGDVRALVSGLAYPFWRSEHDRVHTFYSCVDLLDESPDFFAPNGWRMGDPMPQLRPGSWPLLRCDDLLALAYACGIEEKTCFILGGSISLHALPVQHLRLLSLLGSLRRRARLFSDLFPPGSRAPLPALERLGSHVVAPSWLRLACSNAVERFRPGHGAAVP